MPGSPEVVLKIAHALAARTRAGLPNFADGSDAQSRAIAEQVLVSSGIDAVRDVPPQTKGKAFEAEVRTFLGRQLALLDADRSWKVSKGIRIDNFDQYEHLSALRTLIDRDEQGVLRDVIGGDYLVEPDVVVALPGKTSSGRLHASVSCKWTLRSDRAQNVRHEANMMMRHRRGRTPHIVAVTAEPLPTRLASLARGTGEVDRTYHLLLPELQEAVARVGNQNQRGVLEELVSNERLVSFDRLPQDLLA